MSKNIMTTTYEYNRNKSFIHMLKKPILPSDQLFLGQNQLPSDL